MRNDHDERLTWQIEESVEDIKTFGVIALDKFVGVKLSDVRPGTRQKKI